MEKFLAVLLAVGILAFPVIANAKAKTSSQVRAVQKIAKQQHKELAKYYKAQQKRQKKALKQAQKEQRERLKRLSRER